MGSVYYDANAEPPPYVQDAMPHLIKLLGLDHWDLYLKMTDKPTVDADGKRDSDAVCRINAPYYTAEIELGRSRSAQRVIQCLVHELCHIVVWRIVAVMERAIEMLPEPKRAMLMELARDAEEQTVELLRRSLEAGGGFVLPAEEVADAR